jgi:hypothetical protein
VSRQHLPVLHLELQRILVNDDGAIAIATVIGHPVDVLWTLDFTIDNITEPSLNRRLTSIGMTQRDSAYRLDVARQLATLTCGDTLARSGSGWIYASIQQNNQGTLFASLLGNSAFLDDRSQNFQIVRDILPLVFDRLSQPAEERTTRSLKTVLFESYRFS